MSDVFINLFHAVVVASAIPYFSNVSAALWSSPDVIFPICAALQWDKNVGIALVQFVI